MSIYGNVYNMYILFKIIYIEYNYVVECLLS